VDNPCLFPELFGTLVVMRWEELFEDLEGQLAALTRTERESHVQELTRAEQAAVRLSARLRGSRGQLLWVTLVDGTTIRGTLVATADSWFEVAEGPRRHVVPLSAVAWIRGVSPQSGPPEATRRLSLTHALRALARDRSRVVVQTRAGTLAGRIERVGRDYLDLTEPGPRPAASPGSSALRGADGTISVLLDQVLCVSEAV
jgi:hypothetical protein